MVIDKKFVFLGAGSMGGALIQGLIRSNKVPSSHCVAVDKDPARLKSVAEKYNIGVTTNYNAVAAGDIVLLAVKPQQMEELIVSIKEYIDERKLVISIAAGITTGWLEKRLGRIAVIRSMPNMPVLIGQGAIAVCRGKYATENDECVAEEFFSFSGLVVRIPEKHMNAVTAVSGSGPAYIFYIVEAMLKAARSMGLAEKEALRLILTTIAGSIDLLHKTGEKPEILRKKVTSPGGTTEAAISVMKKKNLQKIIIEAIKEAKQRGDRLTQHT